MSVLNVRGRAQTATSNDVTLAPERRALLPIRHACLPLHKRSPAYPVTCFNVTLALESHV